MVLKKQVNCRSCDIGPFPSMKVLFAHRREHHPEIYKVGQHWKKRESNFRKQLNVHTVPSLTTHDDILELAESFKKKVEAEIQLELQRQTSLHAELKQNEERLVKLKALNEKLSVNNKVFVTDDNTMSFRTA